MSATLPLDHALGFGLAMVRVLGVLLVAPVFSHAMIPMRVRAALAFVTTWSMVGLWSGGAVPAPEAAALAGAVLQEALIGATLGFATGLVFSGFALMGEFASVQGGLGAATVLDPTSGTSTVVLTSLVQLFALVLFLALDGHHVVLRGLALSFEHFPLGATDGLHVSTLVRVASLAGVIFEVAVRLAAPVTAVMVLSNVAVGMLGRAIPQLNLMALQLPAQVGITLLILGLAAGPFTNAAVATLARVTDRAVATVLGNG